jgi:hypothetical protein
MAGEGSSEARAAGFAGIFARNWDDLPEENIATRTPDRERRAQPERPARSVRNAPRFSTFIPHHLEGRYET